MTTSPLATPEQIAAEAALLQLLDDPLVRAAMTEQEGVLADTQIGRTTPGALRLNHAVRAWTGGLIMRIISGDPHAPAILLSTDNTPRVWRGVSIRATGAAGDNPDHVYRNCFVDGAGAYKIIGKLDKTRPPEQFGIEVVRGLPGQIRASAAASGTKVRNQISIITSDEIVADADGSFEIVLGGPEARPENYLESSPEPLSLIVRDVLSDWRQRPTELAIHRTDRPTGSPRTYDEVRAQLLSDLPDYLAFWSAFPLGWMGGVEPNSFKPPVMRDGGWGYQAGVRYDLAPGERIVVTMKKGRARYLGIQVCDPWFLGPNGLLHTSSLNTDQAVSADGDSYTYVISADDPGVANWLDTGGITAGVSVLRWQAVPAGEPVQQFLTEVRLVDQAILDRDYAYLPRLSPSERRKQREDHAEEYGFRYL